MSVDVATPSDAGSSVPTNRRPALPAALVGATSAAALLPDGPWVLVAVAAQVVIAATITQVAGLLARMLVAVAALLAVPPVILLVAAVEPSMVARLAAASCGILFLFVRRSDRGVTRPGTMKGAHVLYAVAGFGVLLIVNSYLLCGPDGPMSVMEHDHVLHAAAIGSAINAGSDLSTWTAQTAGGIRSQPSALPLAYSVWALRAAHGDPAATGADLIPLVAFASAASMILAWLCLAVGSGLAVSTLRSSRVLGWTALSLSLVLIGPVLWLRVYGRWPEAVAVGMLVLATAIVGGQAGPLVQSASQVEGLHRRPALLLSWPPLVLACLTWPVLCLPIGVAVAVRWAVLRRGRGSPRPETIGLMAAVAVGVWWAARTMPGAAAPSHGATELGGPDWRLFVVVALLSRALLALPSSGRPRAATPVVAALFVMSATIAASGIVIDFAESQVGGWNLTELAGLMGLLAVAAGLPTFTGWLVTGDDQTSRWTLRSWRTVAALASASCAVLWIPWGGAEWGPGTVGIIPALPAWTRSAVGSEALVDQRVVDDHAILRCGWDGVIRWPAASPRAGAIAASSMWAAVLAGRTDEAGWDATRYVYPQYSSEVTPDDQFGWLRSIGVSDVSRRLLWVLPDESALSVAARVPSEGVPSGVTLRAVGEKRFEEELAQCVTTGRVA